MLAPCPFPSPQGTQTFVRHLSTALAAAGHTVHLFTFGHGSGAWEPPAGLSWHAADVDVGLRSGPSWRRPRADLALLRLAQKVLTHRRFDVLHVHNVEGLLLGLWLRRYHRLPLVYHAHNVMGEELPGYAASPPAAAMGRVVGTTFDHVAPGRADAVIAFDPLQANFYIEHGAAAARTYVIPPGLDAAELSGPPSRSLGRDGSHAPTVLYAGNADAYQNLPLLLAAWPRVRQVRPDVSLTLLTHGHAWPLAPAPRTGIVLRPGCAALSALRSMLARAAVGVCPRACAWGVPVKLLNYLAAGLPAVACHQAARYLLPPTAGCLAEPHPEPFARAILSVLATPPRRERVRQAFVPLRIANHVAHYLSTYHAARTHFLG